MNWRDLNDLKFWREGLQSTDDTSLYELSGQNDMYFVPIQDLDSLLKDYSSLILAAKGIGLIYG